MSEADDVRVIDQRRPVEPVYANTPVAIANDYSVFDPKPLPGSAAPSFASWVSARAWAEAHWGADGWSVYVGRGWTKIVRNAPEQEPPELLTVPHRWDDASACWARVLQRNPTPLDARAIHDLLNSAEGQILEGYVVEILRSLASRRVVKGASEAEVGVNDTGTQMLTRTQAGQTVEVSLPRRFDVNLLLESPCARSVVVPVFPWAGSGLELRTHVDLDREASEVLFLQAPAFWGEHPVYAAEYSWHRPKRF